MYDGWEKRVKRQRLQFLSHGQPPFTRVSNNLGGHFLLLAFEIIMAMMDLPTFGSECYFVFYCPIFADSLRSFYFILYLLMKAKLKFLCFGGK